MKKKITIGLLVFYGFALASDYNIIISTDNNNYDIEEGLVGTGEITCENNSPLSSEIYKGEKFIQTGSNCVEKYISASGRERFMPTSDQFIHDVEGSLLLNTCKEILDQGHSTGTRIYPISYESIEVEVSCDMETDGGGWTRWWWYENRSSFPAETDVLAYDFGANNPSSDYGFQILPKNLLKETTKILAKDGTNILKWDFNSTTKTSKSVWDSFTERKEVLFNESINTGNWNPMVISGSYSSANQDSFMYREESGVKSFILDDDGCDCFSTLNAGAHMCFDSQDDLYGGQMAYGVDSLKDNTCQSTQPNNKLIMYFREN